MASTESFEDSDPLWALQWTGGDVGVTLLQGESVPVFRMAPVPAVVGDFTKGLHAFSLVP